MSLVEKRPRMLTNQFFTPVRTEGDSKLRGRRATNQASADLGLPQLATQILVHGLLSFPANYTCVIGFQRSAAREDRTTKWTLEVHRIIQRVRYVR